MFRRSDYLDDGELTNNLENSPISGVREGKPWEGLRRHQTGLYILTPVGLDQTVDEKNEEVKNMPNSEESKQRDSRDFVRF